MSSRNPLILLKHKSTHLSNFQTPVSPHKYTHLNCLAFMNTMAATAKADQGSRDLWKKVIKIHRVSQAACQCLQEHSQGAIKMQPLANTIMPYGTANKETNKMKVLAVVQHKGGVGKTTVSRILTEYFGRIAGMRVLGIDLDPQCSYSRRFLDMTRGPSDSETSIPPLHPYYTPQEYPEWSGRSSSADIFEYKLLSNIQLAINDDALVYPYETRFENVDIIPGDSSRLHRAERVRETESEIVVHERLQKFLSLDDVREQYDLVVVDTPPSKGPLTISAMRSATHIIIPTIPDPQSVEGLFGMIQLWMRENRKREESNPINLIGIFANKYRNVRLHKDHLKELESDPGISPYIIPIKWHDLIGFAEADAQGADPISVFDRPADDAVRQQAESLCNYVKEKIVNG